MNPIKTTIEISFDPDKYKIDPNNCVHYNLVYPGSENDHNLSEVSNEVLYNVGKSLQQIFTLIENELIKRKAPCQLRSRKERRG
jgi:hypothetical protein